MEGRVLVGWTLALVSAALLASNDARPPGPWIPALLSREAMPLAALFLGIQIALVAGERSRAGAALVLGFLGVGAGLGWLGYAVDAFGELRDAGIAKGPWLAWCSVETSGLALGIAMIRGRARRAAG